jgi:hypothetical protein
MLTDLKFESKKIKYSDLLFGQTNHYKRLDSAVVDTYKDIDYERGIVVKEGDKYRLIDGYHRCAAAKGSKTIKVFVGE